MLLSMIWAPIVTLVTHNDTAIRMHKK